MGVVISLSYGRWSKNAGKIVDSHNEFCGLTFIMEFLAAFAIYLVCCALVFGLYVLSDIPYFKNGFARKSKTFLEKVIYLYVSQLVPSQLKSCCISLYDYVFFKRNHIFQGLYVVMVAGAHAAWVIDGLHFSYHTDSTTNHVFWPLVIFLANFSLLIVASVTDPGVLTKQNIDTFSHAYSYDGVFYKPGNHCPTCSFVKPARSKHCTVTNRCIYRFDHFCVWTNNCVGGLNYRFFLGFLISISVMCAHGTVVILQCLNNIVITFRLWSTVYLDDQGITHPITFRILAQSLFMQYPRLVFLAVSLPMVALAVTLFTCYHLYLTVANYTTNERYKKHHQKITGYKNVNNIYNQGIINNILEVIYPFSVLSPKRTVNSLCTSSKLYDKGVLKRRK